MFEKVLLEEFQNHQRTLVELDPRVTTLIGDSGKGKSATLRGIRWVCLNDPPGTDNIGQWGAAKFSQVRLWVDDEQIRRRRSSSTNSYKFNNTVPKAFGRSGVPDEIANFLNIGEVNFQDQHDPPFWFTLSAPEVSRQLNSIVNLGQIDATLDHAASEVRRSKAILAVTEDRLSKARKTKKETVWAKDLSHRVAHCEELSAKAEKVASQIDEIESLGKTIAQASRVVRDASRGIVAYKSHLGKAKKSQELGKAIAGISVLANKIKDARKASRIELPDLSKMEQLRTAKAEVEKKIRELGTYWFGLSNLQHEIQEYDQEIDQCQTNLKKFKKSICPTCGQPYPQTKSSESSAETFTSLIGRPLQEGKIKRRGTPRCDGTAAS